MRTQNILKLLLIAISTVFILTGCSENYSNGERIGFITKFSKIGIIWKSWEGELNLTQTGMNTSSTFQFSIDNDNENERIIKTLDSASTYGWKIMIKYHETRGKNWFSNRGETNHFVIDVKVLDKTPLSMFNGNKGSGNEPNDPGAKHVHDTIYLVIWKSAQGVPK